MRTSVSGSSQSVMRGIASKGQLALAGVLLLGVVVMGYGYFQQNKIRLDVGHLVIVAGLLSGVVHIVSCGKRSNARLGSSCTLSSHMRTTGGSCMSPLRSPFLAAVNRGLAQIVRK